MSERKREPGTLCVWTGGEWIPIADAAELGAAGRFLSSEERDRQVIYETRKALSRRLHEYVRDCRHHRKSDEATLGTLSAVVRWLDPDDQTVVDP